jgi:hypothetical protein
MTSRFAARQEVFSLQRGIASSGRFILGYVASYEPALHQNKAMTLQAKRNEDTLTRIDATQGQDAPFKVMLLLLILRCANIKLCCFKNS